MNATCNHQNENGWATSKGSDGRPCKVCKTCGKFIGYVLPEVPAKKGK